MNKRTIDTFPYARLNEAKAKDYGDLIGELALRRCFECGQWGNRLMGGTEEERLYALERNGGDYHFCLLCCLSHDGPDGKAEWMEER